MDVSAAAFSPKISEGLDYIQHSGRDLRHGEIFRPDYHKLIYLDDRDVSRDAIDPNVYLHVPISHNYSYKGSVQTITFNNFRNRNKLHIKLSLDSNILLKLNAD